MDKISVRKTLELLREIKGDLLFYDLHVHPFEVMYAPVGYRPSPIDQGLFSAGSSEYLPPDVGDLDLHRFAVRAENPCNRKLAAKVALLNSRRIYAHTGPRILGDQMTLGLIDRALLLPVVRDDEASDGQLSRMRTMFGSDSRFLFGYCLSNDIPNVHIADELKRVKDEYNVKAIKIHPAITGIDLSSQKGKDRVEAILEASKQTKLKLIIHGGLSPGCENSQAMSYGTLINLQHIDWSITAETIIFAHSGCHGYSTEDAKNEILPLMDRLLGQYPNLAVDTSGVGFEVLCQLMKKIDPERIMFGSDALYEVQWSAMVKLWCVLKEVVLRPEDVLLKICNLNPVGLFGEPIDDVQQQTVQDSSACRSVAGTAL